MRALPFDDFILICYIASALIIAMRRLFDIISRPLIVIIFHYSLLSISLYSFDISAFRFLKYHA